MASQKKPKRRFSAQLSTINRALELVMERMGVESKDWDYRRLGDGKAVIAWLLDGKEYQVHCDEFHWFDDNFRACEQAITLVYRVYEEYKVATADLPAELGTFFLGFRVLKQQELLALPEPTTKPWEILGIERDATVAEIKSAYRPLAQKHHPDRVDGNESEFKRVTAAKEEMLEMRT